jgi:hypothetical protein
VRFSSAVAAIVAPGAELETLDRAADAAEQTRHTCKDPGSRWYHRCEVCDAAEHAA